MNAVADKKASAFSDRIDESFAARTSTNETQMAAYQRYQKFGIPNKRVEGWKWSDFNTALRQMELAKANDKAVTISPSLFAGLDPIEIRIIDGRIELPDPNIYEEAEFGILDPVATSPHMDDHAIAALNVALVRKALGFKVVKGKKLERPILIRHINTTGNPIFTQTMARAEEGSEATIIDSFEGAGAYYSTLFHLGVREGAHVKRYVLQDTEEDQVTHAFAGVIVAGGANFTQSSFTTGGKLNRHETHLLFPSDDGRCDISSAALLKDARHSDFTSIIHKQGQNCVTRQLHKGVARDKSQNIFQGKFLVERSAQKTDAQMTANALLLTEGAEANHKPELEIYADDVECAHGSTSGALDDDALFYLRQRGLDEETARALLIEAFLGEVIEKIDDEKIRDIFQAKVDTMLGAL